MIVFWRLILAHLLTDFTLQTNKLAEWKRKNIIGVVLHSAIFLILAIILTRPFLKDIWWRFPGWFVIILLFVIHFIEDEYRSLCIQKSNAPDNFLFFLWDQMIHIVIIFVFSPAKGNIITEKWVLLLIIAIIVTHFASIVIYYVEQLVYGYNVSLESLKGKYYSMIERLATLFCFLLPGFWWVTFLCIWLIRPTLYWLKKIQHMAWSSTILGYILSLVFGILGRLVFYG